MEKIINYWGLADKYAVSKHKMEKGDHISKYERYEEVKEAYEAGFLKAMELLKIEK
jgi:predicted RNA-binding protein